MVDGDKLKLGLPKGSLEERALALFERAGWKIRKESRNYFPQINDPAVSVSLCRVQEIGDYVARGILDAGITGLDWLTESGRLEDVARIADLVFSKNSNRPCRWVLAVAGDSPYARPEDLAGKRVAAELKGLASRYFASKNIPVELVYSYGATEAKIVEGLADAIIEVTETGATISAHGLKIIDEVMLSYPVLVANREAMGNPAKKAKADQIALLLEGALRAERLAALKMNAPADRLEQILEMLPALNSPTISQLRDPAWVSLETVVDKDLARDLIPRLKEAGAQGIFEYYLNKVV